MACVAIEATSQFATTTLQLKTALPELKLPAAGNRATLLDDGKEITGSIGGAENLYDGAVSASLEVEGAGADQTPLVLPATVVSVRANGAVIQMHFGTLQGYVDESELFNPTNKAKVVLARMLPTGAIQRSERYSVNYRRRQEAAPATEAVLEIVSNKPYVVADTNGVGTLTVRLGKLKLRGSQPKEIAVILRGAEVASATPPQVVVLKVDNSIRRWVVMSDGTATFSLKGLKVGTPLVIEALANRQSVSPFLELPVQQESSIESKPASK